MGNRRNRKGIVREEGATDGTEKGIAREEGEEWATDGTEKVL